MKDKKRKYILMIILLGVLMLLSGCVRKECEEKVKDLEFTVTKEEELPEALDNRLKKKRRGISVLHTAIMNIYTLPEVMEYRRPEDTASPWKTVI